jgi:hypothetical protein
MSVKVMTYRINDKETGKYKYGLYFWGEEYVLIQKCCKHAELLVEDSSEMVKLSPKKKSKWF